LQLRDDLLQHIYRSKLGKISPQKKTLPKIIPELGLSFKTKTKFYFKKIEPRTIKFGFLGTKVFFIKAQNRPIGQSEPAPMTPPIGDA
jgi:hypothetical protein